MKTHLLLVFLFLVGALIVLADIVYHVDVLFREDAASAFVLAILVVPVSYLVFKPHILHAGDAVILGDKMIVLVIKILVVAA